MYIQAVSDITRLLFGPPVVVTSAWDGQANAMIAATVTRAFIIPERPRIVVLIWKPNYTHTLIEQSRAFAVQLLGSEQLDRVRAFGFDTGQGRNKLAGVAYETKATGSPILADTLAYLDCKVVASMDGGDVTCYLADVVDGARVRPGEVLTYSMWEAKIPAEWKPDNNARVSRRIDGARAYLKRHHRG